MTLPMATSAIWLVMVMGALQRRARKPARTSFSGGLEQDRLESGLKSFGQAG
jgi:hypothetical protein